MTLGDISKVLKRCSVRLKLIPVQHRIHIRVGEECTYIKRIFLLMKKQNGPTYY